MGLPPNADSEAVSRAYKARLREAGKDDAKKQRIESAHSSIMMAALTSRLKVHATACSEALPSGQELWDSSENA